MTKPGILGCGLERVYISFEMIKTFIFNTKNQGLAFQGCLYETN